MSKRLPGKSHSFFPTRVYEAALIHGAGNERLRAALEHAALSTARDDSAGRAWSAEHSYRGYTSYASLDDLVWRDPAFAELARHLDGHATAFARNLELDLGGRKLRLDSLWINVLEPGGAHGSHIHPGSVLSGTYYVALPAGAAGLKLEDPRLPLMMAAPPLRARARPGSRRFVELKPKPGSLLLWESWLRHEVPTSRAKQKRISISFNFGWP